MTQRASIPDHAGQTGPSNKGDSGERGADGGIAQYASSSSSELADTVAILSPGPRPAPQHAPHSRHAPQIRGSWAARPRTRRPWRRADSAPGAKSGSSPAPPAAEPNAVARDPGTGASHAWPRGRRGGRARFASDLDAAPASLPSAASPCHAHPRFRAAHGSPTDAPRASPPLPRRCRAGGRCGGRGAT
jgi:hypothetical protein